MKMQLSRGSLLRVATVSGAAMLVLASMLVISRLGGLTPGALSRDVAATAIAHPLNGLQSNIGVLLWWGAASVALFGWWAAWRRRGIDEHRHLLWFGLLTAVLAADDLLQIHEAIAPRYFGLGEQQLLLAYGLAVVLIVLGHARRILASRGMLLLLAGLGCFALSVVIDQFQHHWTSEWRVFLEDGFKLLGIANWSAYLMLEALDALRPGSAER
jgi:hypothetical protein